MPTLYVEIVVTKIGEHPNTPPQYDADERITITGTNETYSRYGGPAIDSFFYDYVEYSFGSIYETRPEDDRRYYSFYVTDEVADGLNIIGRDIDEDGTQAMDDAATTEPGVDLIYNVTDNDTFADGTLLSYLTPGQAEHGTVSYRAAGEIVYVPDDGFTGTDSFTYTIEDSLGARSTATVTVKVEGEPEPEPENTPPVANDDFIHLSFFYESDPFFVWNNDDDPDGDDIVVSSWSDGNYGTLRQEADGSFVYTPHNIFTGYDYFTYTIDDGRGGTDTAEVELAIFQYDADGVPADHFGIPSEERNEYYDFKPVTQPLGPKSLEISTPEFEIDANGNWSVAPNSLFLDPNGSGLPPPTPSGTGGVKELLREMFDNPVGIAVDVVSRFGGAAGKNIGEVSDAIQKVKEAVSIFTFDKDAIERLADGLEGFGTDRDVGRRLEDQHEETKKFLEDREEYLENETFGLFMDTYSSSIHNSNIYLTHHLGDTKVFGDHKETYLGAFGSETVFLGGNDDKAWAGAGMDKLFGEDGSDTLYGGSGSDTLDGGDGADHLYGDEGDDFLVGTSVDAVNTLAAKVYRIYQATLDRSPDTNGLINWVDRLESGALTFQNVVHGFVASSEFSKVYGDLDDTAFISLLYNNVLDRSPDAAGLNGWLTRLSEGASREQIVIGFSESLEFKLNTNTEASAYANALYGREQSVFLDDVFRLYQATLDRAPDQAGLEAWSSKLAAGQAYTSIAAGFTNSTEFQNTYGALDNAGFVNQLYQNVLNRTADIAGLERWTRDIEEGGSREDVVRGFAQSQEFILKTQDGFKNYIWSLEGDILEGGSGNDILAAGYTADVFIFDSAKADSDTVLQIDTWDTIQFNNFDYSSNADVLAHMMVAGTDILFADQGVEIRFAGANQAMMEAVDYLFITDPSGWG